MVSENEAQRGGQPAETTSENTQPVSGPRRRGRAPVALPVRLEAVHAGYVAKLAKAPLSAETRRTYASKVRGYLAWLAETDVDGDPLTDPDARDWAVRDYRTHVAAVLKRGNATVNNALAAIDDFYTRAGFGPAHADRLDLPTLAPRAGGRQGDPALAARGPLRPIGPRPRPRLDAVLRRLPHRRSCPPRPRRHRPLGPQGHHPLLRQGRQTPRHGTAPRTARRVRGLDRPRARRLARRRHQPGPVPQPPRRPTLRPRRQRRVHHHPQHRRTRRPRHRPRPARHTFATRLVRGGTDLVVVADMLGHASLDQIRRYTLPTAADRREALKHLPVDR